MQQQQKKNLFLRSKTKLEIFFLTGKIYDNHLCTTTTAATATIDDDH